MHNCVGRRALLIGVSLAAIWSGSASAAEAEDNESKITDIVVTAQRREQSLQNVPVAVTAVSGESLRDLNINSTQQLVRIDPSVKYKTSTNNSTSSFLIRGIGTSSFSPGIEQSISTVLDGVVLGDPSAISTLTDIERVEILRGPQGMLFGKNASAGVVSFTTVRPKFDELSASVHGEFGENGHRIAQAIVNVPLTDKFAVRLVGHLNQRDGVVENLNSAAGSTTDRQNVWGGVLKARWQPIDDLEFFVSVDGAKSNAFCCSQTLRKSIPGYAPAISLEEFGAVASPTNRQTVVSGPSFGNMSRFGISWEMNASLGDYTLTSITAYRKFKASSYYDGDLTTVNYIDRNGGDRKLEQVSQELRLASPQWDSLDFVAGLYYFGSNTQQTISQSGELSWIIPATNGQVIPTVPGYPLGTLFGTDTSNEIASMSLAAFAQFNVHPTPELTLIAGGRLTHDDLDLHYWRRPYPGAVFIPGGRSIDFRESVSETNFSWRLGVQYDVSDDVMLYTTVSRGYKGPGFSGLTVNSQDESQVVRPEIPTSYEVGIRSYFFDRKLLLNATVFHTRIKDFQAQVADLASPTYSTRITNAGKLRTQGIEANAVLRATSALTLRGGLAYVDGKYLDFPGVQCYFGQPKVAQGGPCLAPPANPNSLDGVFNAAGNRLASAPRFSYALAADYRQDLGRDLEGFVQLDWSWQSKVQFQANGDPGTIQKAYGLLGGNLGVQTADGRYRVSLFAVNLLDKRFVAQISPFPATALSPGGYIQFFNPDSVRTLGVSFDARF